MIKYRIKEDSKLYVMHIIFCPRLAKFGNFILKFEEFWKKLFLNFHSFVFYLNFVVPSSTEPCATLLLLFCMLSCCIIL